MSFVCLLRAHELFNGDQKCKKARKSVKTSNASGGSDGLLKSRKEAKIRSSEMTHEFTGVMQRTN